MFAPTHPVQLMHAFLLAVPPDPELVSAEVLASGEELQLTFTVAILPTGRAIQLSSLSTEPAQTLMAIVPEMEPR